MTKMINSVTDSEVKQLVEYMPDNREDARAYIELVKKQVMGNKGTLLELTYFMRVAKNARLDPTLKQIYAVFRNVKVGNNQWEDRMTIQTGIDGFRASAESTKQYGGSKEPYFGEDKDFIYYYEFNGKKGQKTIKVPDYAVITVKKIIDGKAYEVSGRADWDEFYPGDKNGMMWRKMPKVMLAKCAEAQALRKAFPIISGIYLTEEMQQADRPEEPVELPAEVTYELTKTEIETIEKVKTKVELLKRCGEFRRVKGEKYVNSIMKIFSQKKEELKNKTNKETK